MFSAFSTSFTSTPNEDKIYAHSHPIAPEPRIVIDLGSLSRLYKSSDDNINLPSNSRFFMLTGYDLDAIITFLTLNIL